MKKRQYVVFGLGRFGLAVARTLYELGNDVMVVDNRIALIDEISPYVTHAVQLDATDENAFHTLDVGHFDVAVVAIGENIRDSVLISLQCKEAGVKCVVSKANDEMHAKVLKKIGVDRVVFPERDMGVRVAKTLVTPNLIDLADLGGGHAIAQISTPAQWAGRALVELDVRRKYGVSVLTIRRGGEVLASLTGDTRLLTDDTLFILGRQEDVERVENL